MFSGVLPRVPYYHPFLVRIFSTSLSSDSSFWKIWNILYTFKMQWIFLLMLSMLSIWSWITVPTVHFKVCLPLCQLLVWKKATQLSSCDVKCNWESSLGWLIFSFEMPLIEIGLHTSVRINMFPISFWHSEWLVFLRTRRGLGVQEDVTGLIR